MQPLLLDASLTALEPIRDYLTAAAQAAGLTPAATFRLTLAVDEIATNVINYGYADHPPPNQLRLSAHQDEARLEVVLEDRGQPYDPRQRPPPDPAELTAELAERPIGGLGIFLALNGVDGFEYHTQDGLNRNIFRMHRSAPAGS
jgi:serine/threonine-protein kinase RsbW